MGFDYDYAQNENKSNSVKTFTVPENIVNANPDANMDVVNREYSSLMQLIDKGEDISSTVRSINNLGVYTPATKKAIFEAIKESHPEIDDPIINSNTPSNAEPKTSESAESSKNAEDEVINTADTIPEESESKEPSYDFTDNSSPDVRRAANEEFNKAKRLYDSGKHVLPLLVRDRKTGALSGIDTYLNAAVNKCLEGNIDGANNELINIYRLIQEKYNKHKKDLYTGKFGTTSTLNKMIKELDVVHDYIKAFFNVKGGDFTKALMSPNSPAEIAFDNLYRGYVIEYETLSIREEKLKLIMEQTDSES